MHSCVRGKISAHLKKKSSSTLGAFMCEGRWRFRCNYVWGVGFQCSYFRSDDFGALMCEWYDSGLRSHDFSVLSRWRGRISVHLPEERQVRCIYVWGVRFRYIYLIDHECGVFMCVGQDSSAFTWRVTISVHSYVKSRISVHLLEGWWCRCLHVWGVGFRCIYLRSDDFGAFLCEG